MRKDNGSGVISLQPVRVAVFELPQFAQEELSKECAGDPHNLEPQSLLDTICGALSHPNNTIDRLAQWYEVSVKLVEAVDECRKKYLV